MTVIGRLFVAVLKGLAAGAIAGAIFYWLMFERCGPLPPEQTKVFR